MPYFDFGLLFRIFGTFHNKLWPRHPVLELFKYVILALVSRFGWNLACTSRLYGACLAAWYFGEACLALTLWSLSGIHSGLVWYPSRACLAPVHTCFIPCRIQVALQPIITLCSSELSRSPTSCLTPLIVLVITHARDPRVGTIILIKGIHAHRRSPSPHLLLWILDALYNCLQKASPSFTCGRMFVSSGPAYIENMLYFAFACMNVFCLTSHALPPFVLYATHACTTQKAQGLW